MTTDEIIDGVIAREGGFVDHPADEGGPTNWGITQGTLTRWRARPATLADVHALTEREAREIYRSDYIVRPGFQLLPDDKLRVVMVDTAVQRTPAKAVAMLQEAIGARVDGLLGPATLAAVAAYGYDRAAIKVMLARVRLRGRRITEDRGQAAFAAGWANRDADLLDWVLA